MKKRVVLCGDKWFLGEGDFEPIQPPNMITLHNVRELLAMTNAVGTPNGMIGIKRIVLLNPIGFAAGPLQSLTLMADAWFDAEGVNDRALGELIKQAEESETQARAASAGIVTASGPVGPMKKIIDG
jgi:hypothetical protein